MSSSSVANPAPGAASRGAAAIVLTGGRSSRMGSDKALLLRGGETWVERIVKTLAPIAPAGVVVVAGPEQPLPGLASIANVRVERDLVPFAGPLAALARGLGALPDGAACFVAATDLIHLRAEVAARVLSLLGDRDAAIPNVRGRDQFLSAAYAQRVGGLAASMVAAGERSMRAFAAELDARRVLESDLLADAAVAAADPTLSSFDDADTPGDVGPG